MSSGRVLVTGATGFVGRQVLAPLARRGFEVHGVTSGRPPFPGSDVAWHCADLLRDPTSVVAQVRPSHLVHLAWYAEPGAFWNSPENLRWAAASFELARAFADAGGQRLIAAGTCAEYNWNDGRCVEGHTAMAPWTLYGITKDATRRVLTGFAAEADLSVAWAHLFWMFGPFEHPARLVPAVTRRILAGQPTITSSGHQRRDFLHVADVGEALAALASSDVAGQVNVGSGLAVSIRELVKTLAVAAGRPELARFGELPDRDEAPIVEAAVDRLTSEVGFVPAASLAERLEQTVDWWRRHGN